MAKSRRFSHRNKKETCPYQDGKELRDFYSRKTSIENVQHAQRVMPGGHY